MTLNKFMHPRNLYKKKKPNFKELALKYEELRRQTTQDEAGKVHLDFKDPKALRALTWVLLKDDFDLDVDLPLDRLIPTVPLRLNYILWLADIMERKKSVHGIDIGCGASCIYPLLATKSQKWSVLATEADDTNFHYAKSNVEKNGLGNKIEIVKVDNEGPIFTGLKDGKTYDFTMCNPPFFGSNLEAYAMTTSRSVDRPEPSSVSTASESESITPGGEVEFVRKMIDESVSLQARVRVFTTMLGKKSSVSVLKDELRSRGIKNVGSYEFCQGRTMRWGLGWSYDEKVNFPKSPFNQSKSPEKCPLVHDVDPLIKCAKYDVQSLGVWLSAIFEELNVKHHVIMDCEVMWSATVIASQNTWSHQRRKRRAEKRAAEARLATKRLSPGASVDVNDNMKLLTNTVDKCADVRGDSVCTEQTESEPIHETASSDSITLTHTTDATVVTSDSAIHHDETGLNKTTTDAQIKQSPEKTRAELTCSTSSVDTKLTNAAVPESTDETENSQTSCSSTLTDAQTNASSSTTSQEEDGGPHEASTSKKDEPKIDLPVLFKAWFTFKLKDDETSIYLESKWQKGTSREALHQVMQLIKNRLKL